MRSAGGVQAAKGHFAGLCRGPERYLSSAVAPTAHAEASPCPPTMRTSSRSCCSSRAPVRTALSQPIRKCAGFERVASEVTRGIDDERLPEGDTWLHLENFMLTSLADDLEAMQHGAVRHREALMDKAIPITAPSRARWAIRSGWTLAWLVVIALCGEFLLTVYGKYSHLDSGAYEMFIERHGWLWTHLAGGVLALVLGPPQFLTNWNRTRPRLHRWIGRTYITGLLVGIVGVVGLLSSSLAPFEIRAAFASTALAWTVTALAAMMTIRLGLVAKHQRWMIRNYLVTLAPVLFRIMLYSYVGTGHVPSPPAIAAMLILSWLVPQLIYWGMLKLKGLRSLTRASGIEAGVP